MKVKREAVSDDGKKKWDQGKKNVVKMFFVVASDAVCLPDIALLLRLSLLAGRLLPMFHAVLLT